MRRFGFNAGIVFLALALVAIFALAAPMVALGQNTSAAILRGHVADQTGAVIPGATITLRPATGAPITAQSGGDGGYVLRGVPAGTYSMSVDAPGFASFSKPSLVLGRAQSFTQDVALEIQVQTQQVVVTDNSAALDVNPDSNASAMVLKGKDLEALSDDPDELANELQALAGPSAGPNGGQIYVDGFTGGELPPKSAIREIRINQNPFSAQYDLLGYGRIEILTKPGTDKYHGQALVAYNSSYLNTGNPFTKSLPSYYNLQYQAYLSGPAGKNASYSVNASRRNIQDDSIINTTALDGNFNPIPYIPGGILNPQVRTQFSPRFDVQIGQKNTLTTRLQYTNSTDTNSGIGGNDLPSQALNTQSTETELQVGDTQIINDRMINETRFEYGRNRNKSIPVSLAPATNVQGALVTGGSGAGTSRDALDRYEVQNYSSIALKNVFIRFGGRLRVRRDSNYSTGGYNGTYTFGPVSYDPSNPALSSQCGAANQPAGCVTNTGIQAYSTTLKGQAAGQTAAQIRANGGGPTQYNVTVGTPVAKLEFADLGVYAEDDWKVRPNFTLSTGLRFETQSTIKDKADFGPRVAVAWALGTGNGKKAPVAVLRAGYGIFYTRFGAGSILQAQRDNGLPGSQQQFIITNPQFYPEGPASLSGAATIAPTIYLIAPSLHAAYTMQAGGTLEKSLPKGATVAVTYLNSRGEHQYLTENINAPLPGTYIAGNPTSGVRPFGDNINRYQFTSEGIFRQNQLIANARAQANKYVSFFGFYILNFAKSSAAGGGFVSNSYNVTQDYGNATFDTRNRGIFVGNFTLPHDINLSPFIIANTGSPFNITTGQDLNGDSIYNDRPTFATPTSFNVKDTKFGNFDLNPAPGAIPIPHNYGRGPGHFVFNLRAAKAFGFGPKLQRAGPQGGSGGGHDGGGGGGHSHGGPGGSGLGMALGSSHGGGPQSAGVARKYTVNFSVQALNLFNNINLANPVGTLSSPQFGESTQMAGGIYSVNAASRRIYLQAVFSF